MNLQDRMVLVLGMGETGLSIAKWLSRMGAKIRVADSRMDPPGWDALMQAIPAVQLYKGKFEKEIFDGVETVAISPGVSLAEPFVQQAKAQGIPVLGDVELFALAFEHMDVPRPKILAITGSNGKTTVTAMVGAMLKKSGWDVEVAGNIGPAVLNALMRRMDSGKLPQSWVLEVSSFQLETTQHLNADVATVLNLSEDHLDRYVNMHDYVAAKERIFMHQVNGAGIQVLNRDDPAVSAMALAGKQHITFGLDVPETDTDFGILRDGGDIWLMQGKMQLMKASELLVNGLHNVANALAALALCRAIELPIKPLLLALREFRGLPHRVEKVAAFNGVTFYDDSKSTNVGATVAALGGMQKNVILIAGGDGKGQDFSVLRQPIMECARAVVLIGRDAKKIAVAIDGCGVPLHFAMTMEEAMQKSFLLAQTGDIVLLSPACASLDMFRNYIHRAEAFVGAVKEIEAKFFSFGQKRH
ncbi:UDP-N-acetylmuramoylalanine--D-glutamate ligase [Nitrosomonas cryotolerans]|uniref:UDP-N-acetylmuramoylalanine--D-glutamate ligase n=1 Tax=Nitrosomonas cryotolerans ATCC 49181 TaxID=1131553 RepID=A0A1N6FM80_9PROT|nr:UDP-N-acetylmuramoyl-L-alanine--D-glutamate ligase [Nitrosomonas cryotolerans]SFP78067.1 UDP-N-acetylmuramoylalanine--D-glutamate ligase [Nitrosomonas cryotolerans]SIN96336.1 UDP-N-acetylmuramoylalanine--D-glutamate ligase [Nitrosomonas cryotolerans ATCC 49181]